MGKRADNFGRQLSLLFWVAVVITIIIVLAGCKSKVDNCVHYDKHGVCTIKAPDM